MPDFIKNNVRSTLLIVFVVMMLVQVVLPTFYDIVTSLIEIAVLWFFLFKSGLFDKKK